jgi:predicted amidohydrolase YtcJ
VRGAHLPGPAVVGPDGAGRVRPGLKADLRIAEGRIAAIEPALGPLFDEDVLEVSGAVLLPGLADHHLHLRSLVASNRSLAVGPADVSGPDEMSRILRAADPDNQSWRRAVGYHESVAGELDRWTLDQLAPGLPVRVQHRTGVMWIVSSSGVEYLGLDDLDLSGVERDEHGRPTGRLFRMDEWLGHRLGQVDSLDGIAEVSAQMARYGITGVTDATPHLDSRSAIGLIDEIVSGRLSQRLQLMCPPGVEIPRHELVTRGPCKFMLDDDRLPALDDFADEIRAAHASGSAVAVHCVTSLQLVLTVSALGVSGVIPGDRIEHASVVPPTLVPALASLGATVVTNPGLLHARGDSYLESVEDRDVGNLYRCGSLLAAGIPMAAGTDAPFGPMDPWLSVWAAYNRLTVGGRSVAPDEAVPLETAIRLFLGESASPHRPRRIAVGEPGDLCLLADGRVPRPGQPDSVVATVVAGRVVHRSA